MAIHNLRRGRAGFTLVEALVVCGILAILFAMVSSAVFRGLQTAEDARVGVEINQLSNAITAFKAEYGVSYVPSKLVLRNQMDKYITANALEKESKNYLNRLWPRLSQNTPIGWTGDTNPNGMVVLNGAECLVFFLGGRVVGANNQFAPIGFSSNPQNPWPAPNQKGKVFFDFDVNRIRPSKFNITAPYFYVYMDPYYNGNGGDDSNMPYFYFSSRNGGDYSSGDAVNFSSGTPTSVTNIAPFRDANGRFHKPDSFQIISAGRDKKFGQFNLVNGFITFANGTFAGGLQGDKNAAADNYCNFHPAKMGTAQ